MKEYGKKRRPDLVGLSKRPEPDPTAPARVDTTAWERSLKMRRATMAAADRSTFYRPKKGKYRRRTDVRIGKPVKGKHKKWMA